MSERVRRPAHGLGVMTWREWTGRYGVSTRDLALCALAALAGSAGLAPWLGVTAAGFSAILILSMLIITLSDSRHMLVPDAISLPAIPVGLIAAAFCLPGRWQDNLLDHTIAAALAAAALYGLRWVYLKLRGRVGLGLGDVKLAGAAGSWVGLELLPLTLLLASLAALVAAIFSNRFGNGQLKAGTAVPFGSFIAPAIVVAWIYLLLGGV